LFPPSYHFVETVVELNKQRKKPGGNKMLPALRYHQEYLEFVNNHLPQTTIPKAHEHVVEKLKLIDLTPIRLLLLPFYSPSFGRLSYAPEDVFRCFLAMILCGITSPTDWVNKHLTDKNGFYATISGFLPNQTPSVGCLYLFLQRLLQLPDFCKQPHLRFKKNV
jgi:hypothetical protein